MSAWTWINPSIARLYFARSPAIRLNGVAIPTHGNRLQTGMSAGRSCAAVRPSPVPPPKRSSEADPHVGRLSTYSFFRSIFRWVFYGQDMLDALASSPWPEGFSKGACECEQKVWRFDERPYNRRTSRSSDQERLASEMEERHASEGRDQPPCAMRPDGGVVVRVLVASQHGRRSAAKLE
jgi:hypothetical protein